MYQSKYTPAHKKAAFTIIAAMLNALDFSLSPLKAFIPVNMDKNTLKANPTMKVSKTFSTVIGLKI